MNKRLGFLITAGIDLLLIICGFILVYAVRKSDLVASYAGILREKFNLWLVFLVAIVSFFVIAFNQGLYKRRTVPRTEELLALASLHAKWLIFLMALAYVLKYDFSRFMLMLFVPVCLVLITLGRLATRKIFEFLLSKEIGMVTVLIIGKGKKAREVERELGRYYGSAMRLLPSLVPVMSENGLVIPHEYFLETVSPHEFVQVYIAEPQLSHESILHTMANCPYPHVEFKVVADLFSLATGNFDVTNIDEIPTLEIGRSQPAFLYRIVKRTIDIIGSFLLIIISSPLWIAIAICIKLETPGSVIISQKRIGYKGREFTLWKFRTMYKGVSLYQEAPKGNEDKRITKIGRFLRKTSLDELPQLLNVFLGSMSLVGPRPEMPFIVETYTPWQKKRLDAKPGLTGLWQILGRKDLPLTENLHYDFYYINNQSLILDSVILLRTVPVVLFGKGAY